MENETIKITPFGLAAGFVSAEYGCQAYLIELHNLKLLFDASEAAPHSLVGVCLDAVFVSHSHMDHCGGIVRVLTQQWETFHKAPILICDVVVQKFVENFRMAFGRFQVDYMIVDYEKQFEFDICACKMRTVPLNHAVPCSGLFFERPRLCLLSDGNYTALDVQCDFLVCECTYPEQLAEKARQCGHSSETQVLGLIERTRCKKCWVGHICLRFIDNPPQSYTLLAQNPAVIFQQQGHAFEIM